MIACLGWGSLIWNLDGLPVKSSGSNGPWSYNGPELPVEFARQSKDGRITLVIEPDADAIRVFSAVMDVATMEEACRELALRENISCKYIKKSVGHWSETSESDHAEVTPVREWAEKEGYEGVVWTALRPRFAERYGTPACKQVIEHLRGLSGVALEKAEEYVRKTPEEIRTKYRDKIERALGWTPT